MKVLFVNPNRYKSPPVPPIGLEYIASSLQENGHPAEILDLCFSEDSRKDLDDAILSFKPDVVGVTVRNVDTVLFHTNEFFLDEIRALVNHIKSNHGLAVMIGGTGVSTNPEGVLDYLAADYAIAGPAENTIHEVLSKIRNADKSQRVFSGIYAGGISCPRKTFQTDYEKYRDSGGIIGFETHKGCSSSCVYCIEANSRVSFKNPDDVIGEIRGFVKRGYNNFHLCDSEFNESLEYCTDFCTALKKSGLEIRWAVYMKPASFNKHLFRLMKETGVYLITLTVDSWKKCDLYWTDIEKFIFCAKSCGLKVAVDFLTGFPYENEKNLSEYFDLLRRPLPDSIGVNTYIRLYKSLQITKIIQNDMKLRESLLGCTDDHTFIKPVFYNHINTENLKQLLTGESIFRIEGPEKGVNYTRV